MSISAEELIALRRAHLRQKAEDSARSTAAASGGRGSKRLGLASSSSPSPAATSQPPPWLQDEPDAKPTPPTEAAAGLSGATGKGAHRVKLRGALAAAAAVPVPFDVAPKAMAPTVAIHGELSRDEVLRRKRRRYDETAAPLLRLLAARGVPADVNEAAGEGTAAYHTLLPLEVFDDETFEELSVADWRARIAATSSAGHDGLPCQAHVLRARKAGQSAWVAARVTGWNASTRKFTVVTEGPDAGDKGRLPPSQTHELARVFVCFAAENPENFANRLSAAYHRRRAAAAVLHADLCASAVPPDEYQTIDPAVLERIRALTFTTPMLMEGESNIDAQSVLEEIRVDYHRCMNTDLVRQVTDTTSAGDYGAAVLTAPGSQETESAASAVRARYASVTGGRRTAGSSASVPPYGIHPSQCTNFGAVVASFQVRSFMARDANTGYLLHKLRSMNAELLSHQVFRLAADLEEDRPLTLMNLDDIETAAIRDSAKRLRETWANAFHETVKGTLMTVPKSAHAVHLNFYDEEEYQGTKTQMFMSRVSQEMQDALHHLLKTSVEAFTRFVEDAGNCDVTVTSMDTVEVTVGSHPAPTSAFGADARTSQRFLRQPPHASAPLFRVSLAEDLAKKADASTSEKARSSSVSDSAATAEGATPEDKEGNDAAGGVAHAGEATPAPDAGTLVKFSNTTADMRTALQSLIKRCLLTHSEVRSVERRLFDFLCDPTTAFIEAVRPEDPFIHSVLVRLDAVLGRTEAAMAQYLTTFTPFADLISLDVEQYLGAFGTAFPKTRGVEAEIQRHLRRQQEVLDRIPVEMSLGLVQVDCGDLRRRLAAKCAQAVAGILNLMASRAIDKEDEVDEKFSALHDTLVKPTDTPEEVVATKDFIKAIPEQVFDLQLLIQETREIHDVLDLFQRPLTEDEFNKKWRAISWPARLDDEINMRLLELEETKRAIVAMMNRSQDLFEKEVERMQHVVEQYYQHNNISRQADIAKDVRATVERIKALRQQANTFNKHESLFNLEKTDYAAVHQLTTDFEPYTSLWLTADDWTSAMAEWHAASFMEIDAEALEQRVMDDYRVITKCTRDPRLTPDLIHVADVTLQKIEAFKPLVPTIKYLRTQGMQERHWDQLSKEIGKDVHPGGSLKTIDDMTAMRLRDHSETLMRISEIAAREYQIETTLANMKVQWADLRFKLKPHKETGCFIVTKDVIDDTQEKLDDQMLATQSLAFSPFKKIFEGEIAEWEASLKLVQDTIDGWMVCQKSWLYLEPIFQSEDIARQLPNEHKRFQLVNKNWTFLTNAAHDIDLIMEFCRRTERCVELLKENNDMLEVVERGLNQYLENKRASFARFYFLSDDELLTILSDARDPQKIQPQFRKLFESIARIDMRAPDNEMFGMYSHMKEYIPFAQSVLPRKYVENWLTEIEQMMKLSIRSQLEKGIKDAATMKRKDFILQAPGQVAIAVSQIMWTHECEQSLQEHGSLAPYVPQAKENLMVLVETVREPLTNLQRMNLSGLITIEVHARDIVDKLAEDRVDSVFDFDWVSQLRSYWENGDYYSRQVEAQFRYGGEYLGNTTRLVITPLTDRIYLTLTGAMHMFLGGAPAGPAGTGKTETVKDLAKAVAKQCVVFNCQEGMTYASMGKFFKGLAQAGAWACFDEFNRIDVEVLSVVAQQVSSLQEAARTKQYRIPFEGTEIVVDPSYAVFITMNPGYAGRTELPDNLKVLFRPVACMVPDYAMIAEIRLFSFGYSGSRKLAQKMVATFRLSSEQLSSQDHYDFGMRAVNTVISAAGLMKREHPSEREDVLLLRALRDSNAPKFLEEDLLLFNGIISDLFPGIELPEADYGDFVRMLETKAVEMKLQPTDMFIKKCVQLYEMSVLRHGQMSVGPTMGGKTCAMRVLQAAMTALRNEKGLERFAEVKTYTLNPKSITMAQLYGGFDDATGEWRDGIVGELFRTAARDTTDARQWIVFDGPVDALWIESMNTVLDDNKKLCLISGEIITMTPFMNCWFEVEDLAVASPATVSRAGMIYMSPDTCIGVASTVRNWQMHRLPPTMEPYKAHLQELCEQLFPALIQFVQTQVTEYSASVWPNLTASCFNIFASFLTPFTPTRTYDVPQDKLDLLREVHMHLLVFAIVWSFGATGDKVSRQRFDKFLRDELRLRNVNIELPVIGLLQDYEFLPEERRWVPWTDRLPPFTTQVTRANMADIIVPTADVARYKYVAKLLLTNSYHVLACGPTGTGKTVLLQQLLMSEMPKEFTPIFFTFSARTSANQTQDLIFSKFEVRRRASPQIWGAPLGKKFVVFVDDMNMPMKEQYGAQPPVEILRQYMDHHGWYDRRTREFFNIVDVILTGAMGPPGGGRNRITNRFLRHFNQIAFPDVDDESMKRIFVSLLESYFAPFPEEIRGKVQSLVSASIDVFNTVLKELRPTPSRPHYLFNMRDLSKVIAGMTNALPQTTKSVPGFIRLWLHEEMRTFKDRLVNTTDREWFDKLLQKQVQKHFKLSYEEVTDAARQRNSATTDDGETAPSEILFVDFMGSKASNNRVYQQVEDFGELVKTIEKELAEYNQLAMGHKLDLVMFADAVQHLCRIARAIRNPGGHVLLLGVGGSGRQSLARLAAHLNEFELFQVEVSKGYGTNAWREDVKAVLRKVAFRGKQVLFLMSDTQIVQESMLEDMNNLLNSGEVPNLFLGAEFDDVLTAMKPICMAESVPLDKVSVYARFVRSCRLNLHISLCMSPLGEPFRARLRMFPALVNCCTIDWFFAWPGQALRSVARSYFAQFDKLAPEQVLACTEMCVKIHSSVEEMSTRFLAETRRYNYVTPTSFLELLKTFDALLQSQTLENTANQSRLINGLEKLRETEGAVAGLQQTLAQSQPVLKEKSESIKALVAEMEEQTASAEVTKKEAQKEREAVAAMQAECQAIEQEAQDQLAEALPELDRALESLKNLKSSQITEVAGYKAPTPGVIMTMQGICILFQIKPVIRQASPMEEKKPDFWATAKEQLLSNPNLLMQRLINYDKEHIPEKLIQSVMPLVTSEDFTPKKIAGASQACAAMCQWTHAMVRFHAVNKKVEPLRERLAVAQGANREAQEKLQLAEARLAEVARTLAEMQARKESAEKEMAELEEMVKRTELKLQRAAMLINGLANEKKSWSSTVESLKHNAKFLMGNMLAAAGQIAYCGPFTSTYRKALIDIWQAELRQRDIPHTEQQLSVFGTLQDPVVTQEWGLNGLPMDTLSVENAIILANARRWPLMIDPQTQANRWIRQTYRDSLEVLKPSQKDLIKRIEFCIRAGRPVLLENVSEELDASLNPLLGKQTFLQGGTEMIRISDTAIPWNPKFKFFMTTKHPNPHFIPEVMVRVTLLNFFITPQGLEDQLLGVVVGQERRELETRRSDLIQNTAAMKADLATIQRTILRKLEEVQGDILDDVELIEYLNESKEKTTEIVAKVAEAEEAEVEINASREEYRPIAKHSSCLYFCCSTLSNVDPMYQYSLQWFVQLFIAGIEQATRSDDLSERLQNLQEYFTFSFYQNVSRSLFEKHKLMFSFYLCIRIMDQDHLINEDEFRFLLQGPSLIEKADHNPDDSWLTPSAWNEISFLSKHFTAFKGIDAHMAENLPHYRDMFMSSQAHRQPMHGAWAGKLTPMQRMMFLRCLRPDKLMEAVQDFVSEQMGERFIRPPPFDLLVSFKDSTPTTPLIFVLSQGADPYEDWKRFADTQHMSKKLYDISLGQGQGPRAERMLQEGIETGAWVLLQNCHLATSWMPTLERLVEGMGGGGSVHPSFRLWLTSLPNPHFPVSVLQNGVKMTNEPPKGMQANVTRSVLSYSNDYLESCKKPHELKKLFFSMCFFHGLIQERRKFGPLGWNIAYEYTSGDLGCCVDQIKMFLDKYAEVPYKVIRELSGHIHYGGRVTDDWDRRTLTTLLETFVNPHVMEDDYRFSALSEYRSIPVTNQQGYLDYVASWPINTNPEAFGLHENADITCARSETFETLAAVVLLQGASGGAASSAGGASASGKTPDEEVLELAQVIKGKVCPPFDIDKMRKRYPTKYEDSMNTVLVQEAIRFNNLLEVVHATLDNLPLAIKGEIVMSKELEDTYRAIYNNAVPAQWSARAYPSLKTLAAWVDDLVLRLAMIQTWYEQGHPKVYWISGFFFPQAFLTGILQNCARQLQISIDTISYEFEWLSLDPSEVQSAPPMGCYIHGMFIEGARMDSSTHCLAESKPKVLFEPTPMLWLKPVIDRVKPTEGVYHCPLYKTVRRAGTLSTTGHSTNYVLTVEVPTPEVDPKHWIRRGVAMVCALNS